MQNFTELLMMNQPRLGQGNAKDTTNQVFISPDNMPRTIYVADLPKSITYLELSEFFEKNIGTCSLTIKRPMFKDFYYAFVQFQKLEDAKKAYTEFKYPTLCGVKCRILKFNDAKGNVQGGNPFAERKPQKNKNTQLFVKGLPRQWTHEDLSKAFEKFGNVSSAKVSLDAEFQSRQYGFVQMETEKASQQAISKMNEHTIEGTDDVDEAKLTVCEFVPRLDRVGTTKPRCSTNLYVKNFPSEDFTDDQLMELFAPFGSIVSARVMTDEQSKSKNFGFVCFTSSEDAQKALDHFQAASSDDKENSSEIVHDPSRKKLVVCEFKTKEQRAKELQKTTYQFKKSMHLLNLIVKNVDPECSREEFLEFFQNFGEIKSVKLIPEAQLGFVCFNDREAARTCRESNDLQIRGRRLQVDFCEPKEQRQKRQEEQWDRTQFNKQKASQMQSSNQDVIQLITSLSLLMGQIQNQNKGGGKPFGGQNSFNGGNNHQGQQRQPYNNNGGQFRQHRQQFQSNPGQQMPMNQGMPPVAGQQQPMPYAHNNRMMNQQMVMGNPNQMPVPRPAGTMQMPNPAAPHQPQPQQQQAPSGPGQDENSRYRNEIMGIFMGEKFMQASDGQKKQIIGTHIFKYVTNLVTQEFSPKITGMIIDLPVADLNYSVSTLETLHLKVKSAVQLLVDTGNMNDETFKRLPINSQQQSAATNQQRQTPPVQQAY